MIRNLDVAALRSLAAVADSGGVTRAAGRLNLTQSAVSMQIKRLEEALGQRLLDRSGRGVTLTDHGEVLLSFARRLVALNDEAVGRMTAAEWEGELRLGAPHDVIYPRVPAVLAAFARALPRVRVTLTSAFSMALKRKLAAGELDLILTTEEGVEAGGETLSTARLLWCGQSSGGAWRRRPLPLAISRSCIFRPIVAARLDAAGVAWTMTMDTNDDRAAEASVAADLSVYAILDSETPPPGVAFLDHGGALPELGAVRINLYRGSRTPLADRMAVGLIDAFQSGARKAA